MKYPKITKEQTAALGATLAAILVAYLLYMLVNSWRSKKDSSVRIPTIHTNTDRPSLRSRSQPFRRGGFFGGRRPVTGSFTNWRRPYRSPFTMKPGADGPVGLIGTKPDRARSVYTPPKPQTVEEVLATGAPIGTSLAGKPVEGNPMAGWR